MQQILHLARKHRRWVIIAAALALGIAGGLVYRSFVHQLPGTVWLPTKLEQSNDQWEMISLPIKSEAVNTAYGKAVLYTTTDGWQTIYQFSAHKRLNPATCPEVISTDELLPSGCDKIGTFEGAPVYAINRRLPSGTTEYYVQLKGTFIYIKSGGDGGQNLGYLETFTSMSRYREKSYLDANAKRVSDIRAKIDAETAAGERSNKAAYTKLNFSPAVPKTLPTGWRLNDRSPIKIDGPDADHPAMVHAEYTNDKKQFVEVYVVRLADAKAGETCGPTPGQNMEYKQCNRVPGATNMYESIITSSHGDLFRYVYYPVGDSLVITFIAAYAENGQSPAWPAELVAIQDALTTSAKTTAKDSLKGSEYEKIFYN